MSEIPVMIPAEGIALEALFEKGKGREAVVLCHPHPLYGGSMDNNVVSALQSAISHAGWATLRFNFRGVGGSGGKHGGGDGEAEDVMAAVSYLQGQGKEVIHLAGYSYGAWVALKSLGKGFHPASLLLISPPLDFLEFADLHLPLQPCLITVGDRDDFCRVQSLQEWLGTQSVPEEQVDLAIFPDCDHFYWGRESALEAKVADFLQQRFLPRGVEKNREPGR